VPREQGCTNPEREYVRATKLWAVEHNIFGLWSEICFMSSLRLL